LDGSPEGVSEVLGDSKLANGADNSPTPTVLSSCRLDPKENPGKADGTEEELKAGKLEDNNGKPTEDDKGDSDNGPSNDNEEDGMIDGADNKYHNGNELEASGTPLDIKGTSDGIKLEETNGNNDVPDK
jgi:hypothetical protein